MKVLNIQGNKYVDQDLKDYIDKIWLNYDIEVDNDSNLFFTKNTTVNRLISDYSKQDIKRVIKREKADYVVINRFEISNYPQYYDGNVICEDDTKEIVYGIYSHSCEIQDTIELIFDFYDRKQEVKYVNQNKLNDSINNGFVLDKDSYTVVKELIDSNNSDNQKLAVNMLICCNLKDSWEWIVYLFHKRYNLLYEYDKKHVIVNYFQTLNLGHPIKSILESLDVSLSVLTDEDVKSRFTFMIRSKFEQGIKDYFKDKIGTSKFVLDDFKISYNDK